MVLISHRETNRLFGPSNRPEFNTNVRHRAVLRKALELFPVQELEAIFERPTKLRVAMGSAFTFSQLGKIKTNYVRPPQIFLPPKLYPDTLPDAQLSPCIPRNPLSRFRSPTSSKGVP
jgi:hypothetical protein